jgi:hypothetical protein
MVSFVRTRRTHRARWLTRWLTGKGQRREGEAHRKGAAVVVNARLGEAFGWVLHDEDRINSALQHQKGKEGCWRGGSPKRGSWRWHVSDAR